MIDLLFQIVIIVIVIAAVIWLVQTAFGRR